MTETDKKKLAFIKAEFEYFGCGYAIGPYSKAFFDRLVYELVKQCREILELKPCSFQTKEEAKAEDDYRKRTGQLNNKEKIEEALKLLNDFDNRVFHTESQHIDQSEDFIKKMRKILEKSE